MAGPSALEFIFISVNHSITLTGKVWLIVMVLLRILILLFAGFPLYQDEQERFICNTIQPGCANVCYDLFSPVSLFRFWLVQLVTLCLPYIIFVVYVVHKVSKGLTADPSAQGDTKAMQLYTVRQELLAKMPAKKASEQGGSFTGAYILHLMFRTLLEAGFAAAHYYLFGFYIPRRFLCQHPPCTTQVDCYISRPTEKTVMLNFMLGVAALSLFLNVVDFFCAIKRSVRRPGQRKVMVENVYEEEQGLVSPRRASNAVDSHSSLTRQDRDGELARTGSFRNRRGSKGSCRTLGQEAPLPARSPGPPACNTNGNNGYSASQEEALDRQGSEVALCPPDIMGTPRSIRVSKRGRLKPPPPPRRDPALRPGGSPGPPADTAGGAVGSRRAAQYTLVELASGSEAQTNDDGQDKRSEWV